MDAPHLGQPRVLISRTALLNNVRLLRRHLRDGVRICAMVKADAYGHGAALVADALTNFTAGRMEAPAVDALAVVTFEEAASLKVSPVQIYVIRPVEGGHIDQQRDEIEMAVRSGWTLTVVSSRSASEVAQIASRIGRRASVQVMIDTGQSREGAALARVGEIIAAIDAQPALKLNALCTHFVSSEEPENPFTLEQLRRFTLATEKYAQANPWLVRHAANSGAIFFTPAAHLNMVRPGIALYGVDPSCRPHLDRALRPALKWVAPLMMIRDLPKGASVGYNQTWRCDRPTRIGLVPVGYADGYQRVFSNRAVMMVNGQPAPVVGRVSMDYTTIDLTDIPEPSVGHEITILDDDPLSPASAYALAEIAQTIPYELFCRIGPRVKRVAIEPAEAHIDHAPHVPLKRETA